METLCSRFFADISVTGGHIDIGSENPFLNSILLGLSMILYADMLSSYGNISTKPTSQSFHFDCRGMIKVEYRKMPYGVLKPFSQFYPTRPLCEIVCRYAQ